MDNYRMDTRVYDASKVILKLLFGIFLDCDIQGVAHIPRREPVILMINHISFLDPMIAAVFAPRRIWLMSKKENFEAPLLGWWASRCGAFPIDRYNLDVNALRRAVKLLHTGNAILIAPEGTRSHTGELQRGHDGLAWIAARTGATIVPVGLSGCDKFFYNLKRLRKTRVRAVYGEPFRLAEGPLKVKNSELRALTDVAMRRLAAVLPTEYRGVYAERYSSD